ncbi:MAG: neutral/alkaline non-lysosomal ceramidase N-terminal domain-containing protein [Planctomycetes bacterium]|nr:neutral/alkaline non-lysosomal ceramidase N-terminal domain-containing protein [Planctomycetota bacterium]
MGADRYLSRRGFLEAGARLGAAGVGASFLTATAAGQTAASGAKDRWRIGCYTRPWDKYDYRVALDAIAEAGFKYVGLMTTKSKSRLVISVETTIEEAGVVGRQIKARGLSCVSVYGGGIPVGKSLAAGIEGLRRLIDNCACAAGGPTNLLMGGTGNPDLYERYYKAIKECCGYAAKKGVGISIKPHGGLNATGAQCRKTVEMVGHKNFRIWYDPGNIYYYSNAELDPVDDAPAVDGLVIGMCIKDYLHPKNVLVTPGTGRVDFKAVFDRLKRGGFTRGPLVIECLKPGDPKELIAQAQKARHFVEELTGQTKQRQGGRSPKRRLQAGIAVVDITPPTGYRMSGYFRERLSTGTLNPLKAKAFVLKHGGEKVAMVSCDIIGLPLAVTSKARQLASARTGIPAENILIAATHTHTGPLYWGTLRKHFHDKAIAESGHDPREKIDYAVQLTERIIEAVCKADASVRPVAMRAGKAEQKGLSFNRRFHMKDGPVRFNPGVLNPDIVKVAGPIDPDVGIVFIDDAAAGKPIGAIVNFALHLDTVGGTSYAADYPFYVEQVLRAEYGEDFVLFFGTGTCGDINHIDVTRKERLKTDYIGTTLGQTVVSKADELSVLSAPRLAMKNAIVNAPLQRYTADEIKWARDNMGKVGTRELSFLEQVRAYKLLAVEMRRGDTIPLEIQVIRLGADSAVVGLPGEVFVDIGLAIKEQSPFATTLVIELCQDAPGYIPTKKAFAEGSYETVNSRIAPGGGEMILEKAVALLKALAR